MSGTDPPAEKRHHMTNSHGAATWMVENGWELLDTPRNLELCVDTGPAILSCRHTAPQSRVAAFLCLVPLALWQLLVIVANRHLTASNVRTFLHKLTTVDELLLFYSVQIMIETTYGNSTKDAKKHFLQLKKDGFAIHGLGRSRFFLLKNSLCPSVPEIREICRILSEAACSTTRLVHICTVDETVIGYKPSKSVKERSELDGTPILVVYTAGISHK